uniref:AARP2CN domain-containing protein n=1 Tax=Gopherus evgoodei TaxID=1825980 RepID=A0A8C4YQP0_9SAUR
MAAGTGAVHRAGTLKRQNKLHKGRKQRGTAQRRAAGRVPVKNLSRRRRNLTKQHKEAVLAEKQNLGSKDGPPHLVVVVPLHTVVVTHDALRLLQSDESALVHKNERAEGFALAVHGVADLPQKKQKDAKKKLGKAIEKHFPEAKLFPLNTEQESLLLLRHLASQKQRHLAFRDRRAYLLAQEAEFMPSYNSDLVGILKVSGFVRGWTLNVKSLVHVDAPPDPFSLNPRVAKGQQRKGQDMEIQDDSVNGAVEMEEVIKVLMKADPRRQESLQSEVIPDPMEGEQTWPTEEELKEWSPSQDLQQDSCSAIHVL